MNRTIFAPLAGGARDILKLALDAAGLPTDDLDHPGRAFFELSDDNGPIGFIGIEGDGPDRLLRSLVVLPSRKRQGHGGLLMAHAEAVARREGVERLHLLTTSVAGLFRGRGYRDGDRTTAPAAITGTAQFSSLCPASASYLVKELA
ncbi:arsenic resistance N-acetyltransferase ArsN2 [Sphingomonas trueperi]|uniref:arsenic resistance N-acetyltransferase ArsN2 n=1 Tax=Sphingomonas trueperi TaxID=53317 RepID=UPI000F0E9340